MTNFAAKLLIVGLPVMLSLAWCTFWMVRIIREKKKIEARRGDGGPEGPSRPG